MKKYAYTFSTHGFFFLVHSIISIAVSAHRSIMYAFIRMSASDVDDSRMTMKRHDQIYNLLTMTMGLPTGRVREKKVTDMNCLGEWAVNEKKGPGNKFLSVRIVFFLTRNVTHREGAKGKRLFLSFVLMAKMMMMIEGRKKITSGFFSII